MNNITKSLLQSPARCILHRPRTQQQHVLLPTSAIQPWDENSWTKNTRFDRINQTRNLHSVTISGTKKKKSPKESILYRQIPGFTSWSPQRGFFFRESSWGDSNLLLFSSSTFFSSSYYYCTRRNFSSFSKTTCLGEKISNNHHGVTQPSSIKDKDSSRSTDSSCTSSDSSDSTVTKKGRLQNAAKRGKKAVSKGAVSLRGLIQKYGWTFVGTYLGVYFVTLGTLFISVDSGLIDPVTITSIEWPWHHPSGGLEDATGGDATNTTSSDQKDFDSAVEFVASYMKKFPWTAPYSDFVLRNPHLANFGIAWVATKFTEPIRLPVSIAIVRKIKKDKE
jgi:Protein of unknown function (DUF1279).